MFNFQFNRPLDGLSRHQHHEQTSVTLPMFQAKVFSLSLEDITKVDDLSSVLKCDNLAGVWW